MTTEPYRKRCPEGHVSWQPRNPGRARSGGGLPYYCQSCGSQFRYLRDAKTGRALKDK